jgi:hypothetical protein
MADRATAIGTADSAYKGLYRLGGAAAFVVVVLMLGVVVGFTVYPQPGTLSGWFELFQRNKVIGLLDFWGLEVLVILPNALMLLVWFLLVGRRLYQLGDTG